MSQHVEIIKKELFCATRPPMHVLLVKMLPIVQNYSSSCILFNNLTFMWCALGKLFHHLIVLLSFQINPPNFRVCAQQKVPAERFKFCHILFIWKPKVAVSVFHFMLFIIECPVDFDIDQGIYWRKIIVAWNEKWKKNFRFSYTKNMANFEMFL